jgi:hypothetical protein
LAQLGFGFFEPLEPLFAVAGEVVGKRHPVGDDVGGGLFEGEGQVAQFGGEFGGGLEFGRLLDVWGLIPPSPPCRSYPLGTNMSKRYRKGIWETICVKIKTVVIVQPSHE